MLVKLLQALADLCLHVNTMQSAERHKILNKFIKNAKTNDFTRIILQQVSDKQDHLHLKDWGKDLSRKLDAEITMDITNFSEFV